MSTTDKPKRVVSKRRARQIVAQVTEQGRKRHRTQGGRMVAADYAAGALTVLNLLGVPASEFPAAWTLGIMAGLDPFEPVREGADDGK